MYNLIEMKRSLKFRPVHDVRNNYIKQLFSGILDDLRVDFSEMIPHRTYFLSNFTQRFESEPFGVDVLKNDEYWKIFVPNENSGPCYTYTPPMDSNPGDTNSMYMVFNYQYTN